MTIKDAINLQEALMVGLHETGKDFPYRDELIPMMKESCKMAIEALKKQSQQENICEKCGKRLSINSNDQSIFCTRCGKAIVWR